MYSPDIKAIALLCTSYCPAAIYLIDLPWLQHRSHFQAQSRNNLYKYSPPMLNTSSVLYRSNSKALTNHPNSSKTSYSKLVLIKHEPIECKSKTNHAPQYLERVDIISGRIHRERCLCHRCPLRLKTRCLGKASITANEFSNTL